MGAQEGQLSGALGIVETFTAAAAIKAAVKGEDVAEVVKTGIEMANDIEEGKVKRGLFGKLKRK